MVDAIILQADERRLRATRLGPGVCVVVFTARSPEKFSGIDLRPKPGFLDSGCGRCVPGDSRFRTANETKMSQSVLVRNHPSEPLQADIQKANRRHRRPPLGISVHDHIIVGQERSRKFERAEVHLVTSAVRRGLRTARNCLFCPVP